jgi:multicomponent Na+:H+ antiporter subunit E
LVIDVSDDKKVMYIHGMYIQNKDDFIRYVRQNLEMKLLDTIR